LPHCSRSSPKSLQLSFAPTCAQCTVMEQSFASMPAQSYQPKVDCYLPMRSLQGSSMELALVTIQTTVYALRETYIHAGAQDIKTRLMLHMRIYWAVLIM
jgi:hypothetical protein